MRKKIKGQNVGKDREEKSKTGEKGEERRKEGKGQK